MILVLLLLAYLWYQNRQSSQEGGENWRDRQRHQEEAQRYIRRPPTAEEEDQHQANKNRYR